MYNLNTYKFMSSSFIQKKVIFSNILENDQQNYHITAEFFRCL
jgi:hypothetical protein